MTSLVIARAQLREIKKILKNREELLTFDRMGAPTLHQLSVGEVEQIMFHLEALGKALGTAPIGNARGATLKKSISHTILNQQHRRKQ